MLSFNQNKKQGCKSFLNDQEIVDAFLDAEANERERLSNSIETSGWTEKDRTYLLTASDEILDVEYLYIVKEYLRLRSELEEEQ